VTPDELACAGCGRTGNAADAAAGWALSRLPRPTGSAARTAVRGRLTVHCPECARRHVADFEGRLDP
jgi:hypothetical protein